MKTKAQALRVVFFKKSHLTTQMAFTLETL